MIWIAGAALVLDCYLVLVLTVIGIVTDQGPRFLWLTIGMAAMLAVATQSFAKLLGPRDAEGAQGEAAAPQRRATKGLAA
jgi:hypothetical protein